MNEVPIHFSKMHSLGNDFMVVDVAATPLAGWFSEMPDLSAVRQWADRRQGVGFDQLLLLQRDAETSAVRMRIFNADGSEASQCGNGVRCAAKFARLNQMADRDAVSVLIGERVSAAEILSDGRVCAEMGVPDFDPRGIPFVCDEQASFYDVGLPTGSVRLGAVSMGNPHAVIQLDSERELEDCLVDEIGAALQIHHHFPKGVNVEFVHHVDSDSIRLRVYERGVGETLACGSGACAAVAVGQSRGLLDDKVSVLLSHGMLEVEARGESLFLTGSADWVYDGAIEL